MLQVVQLRCTLHSLVAIRFAAGSILLVHWLVLHGKVIVQASCNVIVVLFLANLLGITLFA